MTLLGKQLPKYTLHLISRICEQSDPVLSHRLIYYFRKKGCDKLLELGFLSQISNSNSYSNDNGDDITIRYNNNKPGYYQNDVWHEINYNDIKQYRLNINLLISIIATDLNITSPAEEIIAGYFWRIGTLETEVPIFFARRIHCSNIFNKINTALLKRKGIKQGIIFTTSKSLTNGFAFSEKHKVISLSDCLVFESRNFHIDINIIKAIEVGNSEVGISKTGFSSGYRSAFIDNIEYIFTKKQAAIIEILDKEKQPVHKHELMIAANSEQDNPKYIFRRKGKYHDAWHKIIKFDNQGYYWLSY
jgi:hypothetical protein